MKRSKGVRRKTSGIRVKPRDKGKIKIRSILAKFDDGESLAIKISPQHQNIPHPRLDGTVGQVIGTQGRGYYIKVRTGGKTKTVLVAPEHIKRLS